MTDPETEADVIARVDAIYRDGLPPRTTVPVIVDGTTRFLVNGLFLECTACGHRVPNRARASRRRRAPSGSSFTGDATSRDSYGNATLV